MRRNFALTAEQKIDAREAIRLLEGSGLTLKDAARIARHLNPESSESRTVAEGIDAFLQGAVDRKMTSGTLEFYVWHLDALREPFGDQSMDSVTRAALRRWLHGLDLAPDTVRGRMRATRAMWRWCLRQDPPLANKDPTLGLVLDLPNTHTNERFLAVDEVAKVMGSAGIYTAALALVFFGGIRIEEVRPKRGRKPPLAWGAIDFDGQWIRVMGKVTGRTRIQENLPENLWPWLEHGRHLLHQAGYGTGPDDPVCPHEAKQTWVKARRALGGTWPKNAHRHSFVTYHVAKYKDTGRTSELIGHEGRVSLLHNRYKGRVTEAEARRYFSLLPGRKQGCPVVPMTG